MSAINLERQKALTVDTLRDALSYDPETGIFRWRYDRASLAKAGQIAGSPTHKKGYRFIRVNYNRYLAHRLAWFYVYGEWPSGPIDHINGNTDDNSIANLRVVTRQQNSWNSATRLQSQTGVKNVFKKGNSYGVAFSKGSKRIFLKYCRTLDEAISIRNETALRLRGEYCNLYR